MQASLVLPLPSQKEHLDILSELVQDLCYPRCLKLPKTLDTHREAKRSQGSWRRYQLVSACLALWPH